MLCERFPVQLSEGSNRDMVIGMIIEGKKSHQVQVKHQTEMETFEKSNCQFVGGLFCCWQDLCISLLVERS